ncbi:MAG: cytochrome c family protein [Acidimicrobiia bacterium]
MKAIRVLPVLLLCVGSITAAACAPSTSGPRASAPDSGNTGAGRAAIARYGCGSCHTIAGIDGAGAHVGPPLDGFARRRMIAGHITNNADNLERWIRFPQSVVPGSAMPDMGVSEQDARDIVAYLYAH